MLPLKSLSYLMLLGLLIATGCTGPDGREEVTSVDPSVNAGSTGRIADGTGEEYNEADSRDIGDEGPRTPDGRFINVRIRKAAEEAMKEGVVSIRFIGHILGPNGERREHKITDPKEIALFMKAFLKSSRKPGAVQGGGHGDSSDTIWVDTKNEMDFQCWRVDSGDVHDYWGPDMVRVYAKYSRPDARHWFQEKK